MRIGLSLSVYEHAAKLIEATPWAVSRDPDLLLAAHAKAYALYRHTPVVVGIDIYNLEAEAYGCTVENPGGTGIPAITQPLFRSIEEAQSLRPLRPDQGRIPLFLEVAQRLKREHPDADVRIPVSGPFSIAQNLLGLEELLVCALGAPRPTRKLLDLLVNGQLSLVRAARDRGIGVAFFESSAAPPLVPPALFEAVELPALRRAIEGTTRLTGKPVPCIIGGDTTSIIPHMLATGTNFLICPAEARREDFLKEMEHHPEVVVRVNLDPGVYTRGTREEIAREVDAVVALARGRPNILLGTGAIPYEAPVESILFLIEYASGG